MIVSIDEAERNLRRQRGDRYLAMLTDLVLSSQERVAAGAQVQRVRKIGFLLSRQAMALHFVTIWQNQPPESFDIILVDDGREPDLYERCSRFGGNIVFVEDVIGALQTYDVCYYSPGWQFLGLDKKPYNIFSSAVRFMPYGAYHGNYVNSYNHQVDIFMSQGPVQSESCRQAFPDARHEMVGYPRLDNVAAWEGRHGELQDLFRLDRNRPTVLWTPTHGAGLKGGLSHYALHFARLAERANVILKPHFESYLEPPDCHALEWIERTGLIRIVPYPDDDAQLFAVADLVVADLGGAIFAAMHARRDVVAAQVSRDEISDQEWHIRRNIPQITPETFDIVHGFLDDPASFAPYRDFLRRERATHFADPTPSAGGAVAELLLECLGIGAFRMNDLLPVS